MKPPKSRFDVVGQMGALRRYARSLTRDSADAEDLVQEALLRAYERKSSFSADREIRPWLLSILHNVFIDGLRRHKAEASRDKGFAESAGTSPQDAPQEHIVRLAQIRAAFLKLPNDQRAALHLVTIEGLSYQEAAETIGIPIGTLMSRIGRARAALRSSEAGDAQPSLKIVGGLDV